MTLKNFTEYFACVHTLLNLHSKRYISSAFHKTSYYSKIVIMKHSDYMSQSRKRASIGFYHIISYTCFETEA